MVSWLTHIIGSCANSIRNRREICTGDHQSVSHAADLGGQLRPGQLAGLGAAGLLAGPPMRPPRPVPAAAAVRSHLPRDRRDGPAQPPGDHRKRIPSVQPNVISSRSASVSLPGPGTQPSCAPACAAPTAQSMPRPDASSPPAGRSPVMTSPWHQPQRKLPLLHRQMLIQLQPPQLIENPLDSPRRCAHRLNPPFRLQVMLDGF